MDFTLHEPYTKVVRLNKYLAHYTSLSRRAADTAIIDGRVEINGVPAKLGDIVIDSDTVTLDRRVITPDVKTVTLILNKPVGYVCSTQGQGSKTVYDLLPPELQHLNSVGRLDKDSSGLLLMSNDGELANKLTHPRYEKQKKYVITLDTPLEPLHHQMITDYGIKLADGTSKLGLVSQDKSRKIWEVTMTEGRNRQIRRTFAALGYSVEALHRTQFGPYCLDALQQGSYKEIS